MKQRILEIIYAEFATWSADQNFCCQEKCSTCCTNNVTITALEAENIIEYCAENNLSPWLLDKLNAEENTKPDKVLQTTNEYIFDILQGQDTPQANLNESGQCPFLENSSCGIYPARPFNCRCFASESVCQRGGSASVAEHYMHGSTIAIQIIEHLGQFDNWGFMVDVLQAKILAKKYATVFPSNSLLFKLPSHKLRQAQPIPGFIIPPEHEKKIMGLLRAIFDTRIGRKTVEQILNGA